MKVPGAELVQDARSKTKLGNRTHLGLRRMWPIQLTAVRAPRDIACMKADEMHLSVTIARGSAFYYNICQINDISRHNMEVLRYQCPEIWCKSLFTIGIIHF